MAVAGVAAYQSVAVTVPTVSMVAKERGCCGRSRRPVSFFRHPESIREKAGAAGRLRSGRGTQQVPPLSR